MKRLSDPRADYIAIASRQFADHGFHGASLAALAQEAGVTKQALLHFFGTKERLYGEVLSALATRLCAQIDATATANSAAHLEAYFASMAEAVVSDSHDARLVIRALLDSDAKARHWPLRPYLDRLIALVKALPGQSDVPDEVALAKAYQFIGAVQYCAISLPTVEGIYGPAARAALAEHMRGFVHDAMGRLSQ